MMERTATAPGQLPPRLRERAQSRWARGWTEPAGDDARAGSGAARAARADWPAMLIVLGLLVPVAFGRWGSYISPANGLVYLSDLLVVGGIAAAVLESLIRRGRGERRARAHVPMLLVAVLAVCVMGLARGTLDAPELVIRDLVPILYLGLVPAGAWAVRKLGAPRAFLWVRRALAVHTTWLLGALAGVLPTIAMPFVGIPVFSLRNDFDMLLCGAAIAAFALDRRARPWLRVAMIGASVTALALAGSRAGLISAVVLLVVVVAVIRPLKGSPYAPLAIGVALIGVVPLIASIAAILASPPTWAAALNRLIPNDSDAYASALNTWDARLEAWGLLIEHAQLTTTRWLFGSGFGSSPVIDSGAIAHLSGDPSVRAAHSFVVTWLAYVGVVGTAVLLGVLVTLFVLGIRNARRPSAPVALGLGLMTGLTLAAVAGVILESPFGYQTFVVGASLALLRPEHLPGPSGLGDEPPATWSLRPEGLSRWRIGPASVEPHAAPDEEAPTEAAPTPAPVAAPAPAPRRPRRGGTAP
ncbi:hypothetical protein QQX10_08615 [Demequina sp. SYSU T00039]|uniref:O-antigen ligase-related domain-containing protein n=1 Tax=Demequina lignilytica TaxID=3051663 RepID=A0AAW7M5J0_9MICO|nr:MULTISPECIES: O-antigen ligase family protein [unclassified Demequina]MDN4477421.1 hypothetical protein [Demequina sp. SYSU T00039-1]MDN4488228.1 hypothetical protein [Demequina sp. SYSU T00039]MDN4490671.1 hypothetical protein [Demequina sp. SYSU T00068]